MGPVTQRAIYSEIFPGHSSVTITGVQLINAVSPWLWGLRGMLVGRGGTEKPPISLEQTTAEALQLRIRLMSVDICSGG